MTKFQALYVKFLRIRCDASWRWVAAKYADRYEKRLPFKDSLTCGNQIDGMLLCDEAKTLLNESNKDGWN